MSPTNQATRLEDAFAARRGALLPYFTAGFPDQQTTADLICRADALGVAAVEIGFPYSDSVGDGPVIQASFHEALAGGHTVRNAFDLIEDLRASVSCGLIAMVSYSIVHQIGVATFMDRLAQVGGDGVILPDLPIEESAGATAAADRAGVCHIGLVAPTTSAERRRVIARASRGFVYQIAVAGTTGERADLPQCLPDEVARLKEASNLPVCVGFGISQPQHVRAVCRFADGAIVGSAVIRRIQDARARGLSTAALVDHVAEFIGDLMTGVAG